MRRPFMKKFLLLVLLCVASPVWSETADTVLLNGKVLTVDSQSSIQEAIAIRESKILAVGKTVDVRRLAGPRTRVIDLQGRTVIPGLIDSHLHGIRAALSFSTEVNWIGAPSLDDALGKIRQAARTIKPGAWLIVAGGWNVQQFKEKRVPTQAELIAAAPNNPGYVQLGYGWGVMTPAAPKTVKIRRGGDLPSGGGMGPGAGGNMNRGGTGGET